MQRVTTHEAKTHLSKILARVQAGEEFLICKGENPVARLTAIAAGAKFPQRPKVGTLTSNGVCWTDDAFDPMTPGELSEWGI